MEELKSAYFEEVEQNDPCGLNTMITPYKPCDDYQSDFLSRRDTILWHLTSKESNPRRQAAVSSFSRTECLEPLGHFRLDVFCL